MKTLTNAYSKHELYECMTPEKQVCKVCEDKLENLLQNNTFWVYLIKKTKQLHDNNYTARLIYDYVKKKNKLIVKHLESIKIKPETVNTTAGVDYKKGMISTIKEYNNSIDELIEMYK